MIKLHMIFVCKYRKKLLRGIIDEDIKQFFLEISKMDDTKFSIEVMETDKDHIHALHSKETPTSLASGRNCCPFSK